MKNQLFKYYGIALLAFLIGSCSMPRQTWKGENHENLITTFDKLSNGSWVEKNTDGVFHFEEVSTKYFSIKLKDLEREGVDIKLTARKCLYKNSSDVKWGLIYLGNWIK
jgi:hypothetical protein